MNAALWPSLPFEAIVLDASAGNNKVQKTDYLPTGTYPVVDQGQELIGGYSDDEADLVSGAGPWVVFGDHTRAVKFLDAPFCMGADGVKVLLPRDTKKLDARFLYWFLVANPVPSAGYSRHYKFLRRLDVPLPPLDEQQRIAAILDKADALREKRKRAIALLDSLTHSIFLEMFGDHAWPQTTLGEITEEFRYGTSEKSGEVGYPTLRIPNVARGEISVEDLRKVDVPVKEYERLQLQVGDLLFVRTNGNREYVGRSAVVDEGLAKSTGHPVSDFIFASYLIRARIVGTLVAPQFLQAYLSSGIGRKSLIERCNTSAGQFNINTQSLASIPVPVPGIQLQEAFANRISVLRDRLCIWSANNIALEALFASLQHRAFSGQL